jgi:hypothetical protein
MATSNTIKQTQPTAELRGLGYYFSIQIGVLYILTIIDTFFQETHVGSCTDEIGRDPVLEIF